MSVPFQIRHLSTTDRLTVTPLMAEFLYDLTTKTLYVGDGTTAGGNPLANGGGFTSGSVLFAGTDGTLHQDNSNLFWDSTHHRLGIHNTSPKFELDVTGQGNFIPVTTPTTASSATQLLVGESTNNAAYKLAIGFYQSGSYFGVLQVYDNTSPSALLLNPLGGSVGIGTTPNAVFSVSRNAATLPAVSADTIVQIGQIDGSTGRVVFDSFGALSILEFRRADGTAASPTAIQSSDVLGGLSFFGYGATGYGTGSRASIVAGATENWSDTAQGTYVAFSITAPGTVLQTERMRIDDSYFYFKDQNANLMATINKSIGRVDAYSYSTLGSIEGPPIVCNFVNTSPANNDILGHFAYRGHDSNGNFQSFCVLKAYATNVTATTLFSKLEIGIMNNVDGTVGTPPNVHQPNFFIEFTTTGLSVPVDITTTGIVGTATNNNASAGNVGEYFEPTLSVGSAITLTSGVAANVISQSLAPGDYMVNGYVAITTSGSSGGTNWRGGITTTTGTLPTVIAGTITSANGPFTSLNLASIAQSEALNIGPGRLSIGTTTTIYLVTRCDFTGTAPTAFGYMAIRRMR